MRDKEKVSGSNPGGGSKSDQLILTVLRVIFRTAIFKSEDRMALIQWIRNLIKRRKIDRRRRKMYPNGVSWKQISPGLFTDRMFKIRLYLKKRRVRESKRYYREVLGLSEDQINEIYRKPAAS